MTKKALKNSTALSDQEASAIQKLEKELLTRDTKYLKVLANRKEDRKWADQFFIQNKIDQRSIALQRLQQKSKLPKEYAIVTQKTDPASKVTLREKSAQVQYNKALNQMGKPQKDRYELRKLYQSLDSIYIFQSSYKATDSLLTILGESGKTRINIECPDQLSSAVKTQFTRIDYPWFESSTNETGSFPMTCTIKEAQPTLTTQRDSLLECLIVNDDSRDSIRSELYVDPVKTLRNLKKANRSSTAMTYSQWLIKQATFCYEIDWVLEGEKYLFTVCDEFENIYKVFNVFGNDQIVSEDNCLALREKTKNMSDELVIAKAKQNTIRKLLEHLEEVSVGLDLEQSNK